MSFLLMGWKISFLFNNIIFYAYKRILEHISNLWRIIMKQMPMNPLRVHHLTYEVENFTIKASYMFSPHPIAFPTLPPRNKHSPEFCSSLIFISLIILPVAKRLFLFVCLLPFHFNLKEWVILKLIFSILNWKLLYLSF